jgi:hypothetical protein
MSQMMDRKTGPDDDDHHHQQRTTPFVYNESRSRDIFEDRMKTLRPSPVHIVTSYPEIMYPSGYLSNYPSDYQVHDPMIFQPSNYISPLPYNIVPVSPVYYAPMPLTNTNGYVLVPPSQTSSTFAAYPSTAIVGPISIPMEGGGIRMEETMMQMPPNHPYSNTFNNNLARPGGNPPFQEHGMGWQISGVPVDSNGVDIRGPPGNNGLSGRIEDDMILDNETPTQKLPTLETPKETTTITPMAKRQLQTEKDLPYLADEKIRGGLYMRKIDRFEVTDEKGIDRTCSM